MDGRIDVEYVRSPELIVTGVSPGGTDERPTKAGDVYAFGVMAFEV